MKNYIPYLLGACLVLLSACGESYLNTEPTMVTDGNFYKTPEDAYKGLIGCYDGLQGVWSDGVSLPVASEVFSDDAFGGTGNSDGFGYQMMDEFDKNRSTADQNLFVANWSLYYKAVFRCNLLISKFDGVQWGDKVNLRNTYESEARFIRAYLYFDMVRLWGNIPLLTTPSKDNIPPASPDDVYKVIADDLKFGIDNLTSSNYAAQPASTHGRITKWAAEALLARVYLYYTGYYGKSDLAGITKSQVLTNLEDVISNSGHALVNGFANLWPAASVANYAGEDNIETVFAIKYTYTSTYGSTDVPGNIDGNYWMVIYGMREQSSYPYGNGWGGATVNPKLWNAYSASDTRRGASIISITDEHIKFINQAKQREYTGYYNKKYSPMVDENGNSLPVKDGAVNFMIGQFEDYVSIRYADVLLMAAELGSANAQTYFDQVRQRAYKENFATLPVTQSNIMNERYLEFALEGIRYWDLLRQGIDKAASTIAETTQLLDGGAPATKTISADKILQTKGLQQIPNSQITLSNGVLKQNEGW